MSYDLPPQDDSRIDVGALFSAIVRRLPRILLVTLGLLVATFVFLMFQPRMYESSSAILVEPRNNAYVRASNEQAPSPSGNEVGVVSSQIELLKSRDTLLGVIDALDLRSVPEFNGSAAGMSPLGIIMQLAGRRAATPDSIDETVLNALNDRLSVSQERDSRIISVVVSTTDPALSARIANAVAAAHVARRAQLSISDTADASGWLRAEIDRLRVSVSEAESAVAEFKVNNDLFVGQNNTSLLDQQLSTVAAQITASQERRNSALSRASLIRGMIERNQPLDSVPDVRDSVVIQRLSEDKARLQGEQAQLSATLLANHPSIRALNAQITELNNQIRTEGARVAAALEAEAQIEADLIASSQAELARAKSTASVATRDTVTLDSLEREAKAQRDLLEAYLLRFNEASSRVDANSALPDVRVVSEAAPSVTPSSPKTSLIMIAVAVLSVIVQIGVVAFAELMSGRALVPVSRSYRHPDELDAAPFHADELEPDQRWEAEADMAPMAEPTATPEPLAAEPAVHDGDDREARRPVPDLARSFIRNLMAGGSPAQPQQDHQPVDDVIEDPALAEIQDSQPLSEQSREDVAAEIVAQPVAQRSRPEVTTGMVRYTELASDLVLGRTHLLLLADDEDGRASQDLAEDLIGDAIAKGLSVALIDAGTGRRGDTPGITDLSSGHASFGDVVQKSADNGFAEVCWGQGATIERRSNRPQTLAEALGDIYEVVLVLTGPVGRRSSLDVFAELGGRIVLVASDEGRIEKAEAARRSLEDAGLARVEITALRETVAA